MQTRLSDEKMNVLFLNYFIGLLDVAVCLLEIGWFNFVLLSFVYSGMIFSL